MDTGTIKLGDIKKMRLARHWSQEQLAEMSGLSVRTIQRIEKGENAGLESLKALAAVFETNISDANKQEELEQTQKEQAYLKSVKGFYALIAVAILSLAIPFISALDDSLDWGSFLYFTFFWLFILGAYALNAFDLFGKKWEQKVINKKFK